MKRVQLSAKQDDYKRQKPVFSASQLFKNQQNWKRALEFLKNKGGVIHPVIESFIAKGEVNILQK